jgi:hypothetical protein
MQGKVNEQELAGYLARSGQFLLPMVDLIEQCRLACDELIDLTGRAAIDSVLQLSASQAAGGPAQQGNRRYGEVVFHGSHRGQVMLSDRKLEVQRPRLRTRGQAGREVEVPAYATMQNGEQMGARMLEILMRGVSTRNYKEVIPSMAETAGVSRSAVSRRVIEASEAEVEALLSRSLPVIQEEQAWKRTPVCFDLVTTSRRLATTRPLSTTVVLAINLIVVSRLQQDRLLEFSQAVK